MHRFHQGHGHGTSPSRPHNLSLQFSQIAEGGFPFSKKLIAHKSCVNAISFSSNSGRWLASAGDDLRVLLWDFHQENVNSPCSLFTGHRGSIFCLAFSPQNQYIYSGSTDSTVLKYDVSRASSSAVPSSPIHTFTGHEIDAIVKGVSCHPYLEDVVMSAGEDGRVVLNDSRAPNTSPAPGVLEIRAELTDIKFHPEAEKLFLTSDARGTVCLRDTRMAFGGNDSERTRGGIVQEYLTKLSRRSVPYAVQPEASSVSFDRSVEGNKFSVLFLDYFPTIYATSDPVPLAVCSGRNLPDGSTIPAGQSTYANTCTIKHGSFGGPASCQDDYFCTGSDDFRAYCWKIPDLARLADERKEVESDEWADIPPRSIGFVQLSQRKWYILKQLDTPLFRLNGHASIVNSAVFHPTIPQIVTAGVERNMIVHNPTPTAPNGDEFEATSPDVRQVIPPSEEADAEYRRALIMGPPDPFDANISEREADDRTINFFDGVIRENEGANIFMDRPRVIESDAEDSED